MTAAIPPRAARRFTDQPDPTDGWRGADVTDAERVDDDFIATDAARIFDPLQPEEERLFAVSDASDVPRTARHIVTFDDLVAIARRVGCKVVAAPSSHRGKIGEMGTVMGVTCHYTGTANTFRSGDEYPDYNVVKEGRAGLNNSLSAYGGGRSSTIYVFSEDLSYHAGTWSWAGITDGNGHFLGIEMAGVGDWTAWQRKMYPRLVASILLFINAPINMAPTHAAGAWPRGRKVDFLGRSLEGFLPEIFPGGRNFYDAISWLLKNPAYININYKSGAKPTPTPTPTPEDDMPTADEVADAVIAKLRSADFSPATGTQSFQNLLSQLHTAATDDLDSLSIDGSKYTPRQFLQYIDRHAYELNREKVPEMTKLLTEIRDRLTALIPPTTT